jgi:hypothetical protein
VPGARCLVPRTSSLDHDRVRRTAAGEASQHNHGWRHRSGERRRSRCVAAHESGRARCGAHHELRQSANGLIIEAQVVAAYPERVGLTRFFRRFTFDVPGTFSVVDEVTTSSPRSVQWFLHTDVPIERREQGFAAGPLAIEPASAGMRATIEPTILTAPGQPGSITKGAQAQRGYQLVLETAPAMETRIEVRLRVRRPPPALEQTEVRALRLLRSAAGITTGASIPASPPSSTASRVHPASPSHPGDDECLCATGSPTSGTSDCCPPTAPIR